MAKNPPSPEVYNKLIRCCKYFWFKNSIITLNCLYLFDDDKFWRTRKINGFPGVKLQIKNLNQKLWIYKKLLIDNEHDPYLASSLIPKIYQCDLFHLDLSDQILTFNEFKIFTSSGSLKWLCLFETFVKTDDGPMVPIEKLIELFPSLLKFEYFNVPVEEGGLQTITSETAANLVAIPHFPKIKRFTMYEIPESFEI